MPQHLHCPWCGAFLHQLNVREGFLGRRAQALYRPAAAPDCRRLRADRHCLQGVPLLDAVLQQALIQSLLYVVNIVLSRALERRMVMHWQQHLNGGRDLGGNARDNDSHAFAAVA